MGNLLYITKFSPIEYKNGQKIVKQWRWLQSSDQNNVVCFDISTFLM